MKITRESQDVYVERKRFIAHFDGKWVKKKFHSISGAEQQQRQPTEASFFTQALFDQRALRARIRLLAGWYFYPPLDKPQQQATITLRLSKEIT